MSVPPCFGGQSRVIDFGYVPPNTHFLIKQYEGAFHINVVEGIWGPACSLGAYSLGQPVLDLSRHTHTHALESGAYSLRAYSLAWGPTSSGNPFWPLTNALELGGLHSWGLQSGGPQSLFCHTPMLQSGESEATDFGSCHTPMRPTVSGNRIWICSTTHPSNILGAYSLGQPMLDLFFHTLVLQSGALESGRLQSQTTNFGSVPQHTRAIEEM